MAKRSFAQTAWSSGKIAALGPEPMQLTKFELECDRLNIPSGPEGFEAQKLSTELYQFAQENRFHRYVPEQLLAAWHMTVEESEVSIWAN